MIKTALWELQKSVFNRLDSDSAIKGMVNGVFDEVPEGTVTPFIQIGDDTVNPYSTKTNEGEETTLTLHVWSAGPGKKETKLIMAAILEAMTKSPLTVNNFKVEGLSRELNEIFNDGQAYHGVCRFRIYTKQI